MGMFKSQDGLANAAAAQAAAQAYADGLVVGLLDDRGNYNASGNVWPSTGGSGTAGAINKGDVWVISVAGTLGGTAVEIGDVIRALSDAPGQTAANWVVTERNLGFVPENSANKDASGGYAGLTGYAVNVWNAAKTFVTKITGNATQTRTQQLQDRDGTFSYQTGVTASLSSSSGVCSINVSANTDRYALTLTENVTSWSISNLPASGEYRDIYVSITQNASSAKTVAWTSLGSTIKYAGGSPTVSTVLSSQQSFMFRFFSDGTVNVFYAAVFA